MIANILIGVLSFLAGAVVVLFLYNRGGHPKRKVSSLNRFNFDKQKKYEKDGRKYPFSY